MKQTKILPLFVISLILWGLFSCTPAKEQNKSNDILNATLWVQRAAEYKALSLQAYNVADHMLQLALKDKSWSAATEQHTPYQNLQPAIVLDIDETVLNNSPYQGQLIGQGTSYSSKSWTTWCNKAQAKALPGAVAFCNKAHENGVTVFYVTNRKESLKEVTRKNLQKQGFPLEPNLETILPRKDSPDKGSRRAAIAKNYRILLLLGDNAGDFFSGFTHTPESKRDSLASVYASNWGTKWIVLPNPMYGDWEGALYDYHYGLSKQQKQKLKLNKLLTH